MFSRFFKKNTNSNELNLLDIVKKSTNTGYIFCNIHDDLGASASEIMSSTQLIKMSYAYARRSAAAALYVQGVFDKASYEHVVGIFKSLQQQTGHTIEFQEAAAANASKYLNSYHHLITSFFEKKVIQIANEYDVPGHQISDADLFGSVIDTAYAEISEFMQAKNATHCQKNYNIELNKFTVIDTESGDKISAEIKGGAFHGVVFISNIGVLSALAPWPIDTNPFEDETYFCEAGTSPQGAWSFSIRPTAPFSQILKEVREQYVRVR